ncbi:hypothetical protein [Andreprevotia chitinilytica]|uniref:hypothetical protein n=1 Tax=Andreprevotia chitinilytica TaxID=396808 RepID=UPI0005540C31|nr:hypothetical protein [Andreprevotia chitinilytica]
MNKAALNLFLQECAAVSLQNSMELEGGLASTLQKRHKIRDVDLKTIFQRADQDVSMLYSKIYLVTQLVIYSGAAYDPIGSLYAAAPGNLHNAQVKPHWDPGKFHSLGDIYEYEPMNLFPGWSLTNTRNQAYMLDPHKIFLHPNATISTDLHGELRAPSSEFTEGMHMARQLYKPDSDRLENRLSGHDLPGLTRQNSAYSAQLLAKESDMVDRLHHISGDNTSTHTKQDSVKLFTQLLKDLKATTQAGSKHYTDLIHSLTIQKFSVADAIFNEINKAKFHWDTNRGKIIQDIEGHLASIKNHTGGSFSMDLPCK